jgi:hypothetical protein
MGRDKWDQIAGGTDDRDHSASDSGGGLYNCRWIYDDCARSLHLVNRQANRHHLPRARGLDGRPS